MTHFHALIHETTVYRLTVPASNPLAALQAVYTLLDTDRDWRTEADILSGGSVSIAAIQTASNERIDHA